MDEPDERMPTQRHSSQRCAKDSRTNVSLEPREMYVKHGARLVACTTALFALFEAEGDTTMEKQRYCLNGARSRARGGENETRRTPNESRTKNMVSERSIMGWGRSIARQVSKTGSDIDMSTI